MSDNIQTNTTVLFYMGTDYVTKALKAKRKHQIFKKPDVFVFLSVEATGFEPATSASRTQRSTKLSHASLYEQL